MSIYRSLQKSCSRLTEEWKSHGKIIIAVDFDDTIFDYHEQGNTCDEVISLLKKVQNDATIFCHTASDPLRYEFIENHFKELGIQLYGINESPVKISECSSSKPYANIYLDDRAGLGSSVCILRGAYHRYIKSRKGEE